MTEEPAPAGRRLVPLLAAPTPLVAPSPLADDPVVASNVRGTVAFAHTGPDTRLTQVYVYLADNPRLDADGFAPFGRVVEGMDVVESLYGRYGEEAVGGIRAGRQGPMLQGGNAILDEHFPKMDRVLDAWILDEGPSPGT